MDYKGLTKEQARLNLEKYGPNELEKDKGLSFFGIIISILSEPMFFLLVSCGVFYFFLGDIQEALTLFSAVLFVIALTFYQENKTEKTLEKLRTMTSPRALVVRDGQPIRVAGIEVVPEDLLLISEGDRIAADAVLLTSEGVYCDESMLTGESIPVEKKTATIEEAKKTQVVFDSIKLIHSGTLVTRGRGSAYVIRTGQSTEIGKIGKALSGIIEEKTLVQKEVSSLVKKIALAGGLLCLLIFLSYGIYYSNWTAGLLSGLTLAMAILPEEFPMVLTVFMALGAWRISKKGVLTRKVPAIETLGAATVLCVDKTGTLTMNKMSIVKLFANDKSWKYIADGKIEMEEEFHELMEFGILACEKLPYDPMENAFHDFGNLYLKNTEHIHTDWQLIREYQLSDKLLAISHAWKSAYTPDLVIAAKGAPESIFDLCHMSENEVSFWNTKVHEFAFDGLRVLGVAKARYSGKNLPEEQHDFDFEFLGLIGLIDPLRDSVPPAVVKCHTAGIRVIMITGDYPETALSIAKKAGISTSGGVITGKELTELSENEVLEKVKSCNIFARMSPFHKLRLVDSLKKNGEIVVMTGDGVNDSPALKSSHIGIAMGSRGSDVARESSSFILLDDNFDSIVAAVELGRRIFDNLRKAMSYLISVHVPIAGISFFPIFFEDLRILLPVHIVFLELIIDPACSIIFEAEPAEKNIMEKRPRQREEKLFRWQGFLYCFIQGLVSFIFLLIFFLYLRSNGYPESDIRSLIYLSLIFVNLILIYINRTQNIFQEKNIEKNYWYFKIIGSILFFTFIIYTVPFFKQIFHFSNPKSIAWIELILMTLVTFLGLQTVKYSYMKMFRHM